MRSVEAIQGAIELFVLNVGTELCTEATAVGGIGERPNAGVPAGVDGSKHCTSNRRFGRDDLTAAVDVESHNFYYHPDELVDVGLVDKRQRRTADSYGFYTYYRPTAMGRGILEHGVEELMRREREFDDAYS